MPWYVYRYLLTNLVTSDRVLLGASKRLGGAIGVMRKAMAEEGADWGKCFTYDLPSGREGFAAAANLDEDLVGPEPRAAVVFAVQASEEEEESL